MSAPDHSWRITSNNNTQPIPASKQAKTIKKNQSPKIQNGSSPIIYASIINSTSWDTGQKYGIYSFSPDEYSFTLIKSGFGFNAMVGLLLLEKMHIGAPITKTLEDSYGLNVQHFQLQIGPK